jgi:hypothetical protein
MTMNDETAKALKYLRLRGLLDHWDEYLALARKQGFSHVRLLEYVLDQEWQIKVENARQLRIRRARIPEPCVMETYPFDRQPSWKRKKMLSCMTPSTSRPKNKIFSGWGPRDAGKRHRPPLS